MRRKNRGFTLLEVMFAAAALAIIATGVMASYFYQVNSNKFTNDQTRSFKAAHQIMETLLTLTIEEMINYDQKTFTDVYNRTQSLEVTTWTGEPLDQGYDVSPVDEVFTGEVINFEPDTKSAPSVGLVRVYSLDSNWNPDAVLDPGANAFRVEVSVDAFSVQLSHVRTRY